MLISRREVLAGATAPLLAGAAPRVGWETSGEVAGLHLYAPGPGKRPLVIALHGWSHSPELWRRQSDLAPLAEKHGCVIAMPSMGKTVYESKFYPETRSEWTLKPGTAWVGEDLLPYLKRRFEPTHVAVIGYSTGGRGALLVAESFPGFSFVGALSGTFDLMRLAPGDGEYKIHAAMYGPRELFADRWRLDNCVLPTRLAWLDGVRVFAAHGAKDKVVKPDQLEALRGALEGRPVKAELTVVPRAGHDWKFWSSQWPALFAAAAETWA